MDAVDMVSRAPKTMRFALNHLGAPDVKNASAFDAWAHDLAQLARFPNVYLKVNAAQLFFCAFVWSLKGSCWAGLWGDRGGRRWRRNASNNRAVHQ